MKDRNYQRNRTGLKGLALSGIQVSTSNIS